jgi:DNA-binding Lrp family transcriptional regulator
MKKQKSIAKFPFVTHCYRRTAYPDWPYSLYAMVHGKDQADFDRKFGELNALVSFKGILVLSTMREYKKTSFRLE